ncbi:hypothetical protein ACLQ2D_18680 [Streptomyces sp. DT199]|uniref:hypothetical protein n=1 Tax=Streptomyces TaxID=1883 RepID=UPI0033A5124D
MELLMPKAPGMIPGAFDLCALGGIRTCNLLIRRIGQGVVPAADSLRSRSPRLAIVCERVPLPLPLPSLKRRAEPRNLNRSFEALCVDARMIMEVLGHGSIRVTMDLYTFVRLDSQRCAFDRVGDALRGYGNDPDDDGGAAGVLVAVWTSLAC